MEMVVAATGVSFRVTLGEEIKRKQERMQVSTIDDGDPRVPRDNKLGCMAKITQKQVEKTCISDPTCLSPPLDTKERFRAMMERP